MAPTRKGRYFQCIDCIHKTKEDTKYPCTYSHKEVRQASGVKYERDFKICGLKEHKYISIPYSYFEI